MKPERWQEISRIFNRAISLDAAARSAYVDEKCGADDDLKAEVERLIESHQRAEGDDFIGGLAVEDAAEHFSEDKETLALNKGQAFGDYLILDHLGTGGMGQVYLARDSRLGRTVALKLLASDVAADKRRMQRFRQEAKVTSSLNQPNILTIFEFGEVDSLTFLASEFVDGETLRDYLRGNRLKLTEVLDISIQILAALDAAHEANIVHRDMKPENVMIRRRDRLVKVLDFGLAKLTEKNKSSQSAISSDEEAVTQFKTAPGLILGTVNYMSPEQAQAKAVDVRSDIWSVGVMIYEMVAGEKPFGGSTTAHTIVEILEKEPGPLARPGEVEVPAELRRIVAKAIAKSPDERYQTAKDLLIDLRNLKKKLELGTAVDTVQSPRLTEPEISKSAQSKRMPLIALAAVVAVVTGIIVLTAILSRRNTPVGERDKTMTAVPAPPPQRTLAYWITVQKFKDDKPFQSPFPLRGEINFEADYRIRLNVRSDRPGYLYVVNEGPPSAAKELQYVALFPSATANQGSGILQANEAVIIPEQTWFRFDEEEGVEKVWLVFSERSIPLLDGIKAFASARTRGLITEASLNRAINGLLAAHSAESVTVEKGENHTSLKTHEEVLVYPIRLEHH